MKNIVIYLIISILLFGCSQQIRTNKNNIHTRLKDFNNKPTGCIQGDCINGYGTYYSIGIYYEGKWQSGILKENCIIYYGDKSKYEGQVVKNTDSGSILLYIKNGSGILTIPPEERNVFDDLEKKMGRPERDLRGEIIIEGFWKNDELFGKRKISYWDGRVSNIDASGNVIETYPNGDKYVGKNNYGTYYYSNGSTYQGQFKDGLRSGNGTYKTPSGEKYIGLWANDKPNGKGTHITPFGKKYIGEFLDGLRHGWGTSYNSNGTIEFQGKWFNNKYIGDE